MENLKQTKEENFKKQLIRRLNLQGFNLSGEAITTIIQVHNEVNSRQSNELLEALNNILELCNSDLEQVRSLIRELSINAIKKATE